MADFIPPGDGNRKIWCTAFKTKIATHGAAIGLTPAEIAAAQALCDAIIGRIDDKAAKKNAWQSSVTACTTGNNADFGLLRSTIAAFKTDPGYNDPIGVDLGVVGTSSAFDPSSYKAELLRAIQTGPNAVTLMFGRANGNIDGVNAYMRLQGTSEWKFLARDTVPPYVDTTPLAAAGKPEVREYRIRAVINDEEIGDYSDIIQITVS